MSEILFPRKHNPYKVFFTWQITYHCNYNCTYCHAKKHGDKGVVDTVFLSAAKWGKIWDKIYDMYGECDINISGGEPTVYPNFLDLVRKITKKHRVEIITNLSYDIDKIIKYLNPERVRFSTSFHPEHTSIDEFIKKVRKIKDNNFIEITNFVPWIPFLKDVEAYKEKFDKNGIKIVLQPFVGIYNGIEYPAGYTKEEKKLLGIFHETGNPEIVEFKTTGHIKKADNSVNETRHKENKKTKEKSCDIPLSDNNNVKEEKMCRMGENYAFIHPNGDAERCCKDHSLKLGNVVDGTFRLLEEALSCDIEDCYCWRRMLTNNENFWVPNWRNGWDRFYCSQARSILSLARENKISFEKAFLEIKKYIDKIYDYNANIEEIELLKHNLVVIKLQEGWNFIDKGLYEDAKSVSKILIEQYAKDMFPNTLMHLYLYTFRIYFLLKEFNEAKKYLNLAKEQNPSYPAIYKLFAMAEFELKNYKSSVKMFHAALRFARQSGDKKEQSEIYHEAAVCLTKYIIEQGKSKFREPDYILLVLLKHALILNYDNQDAIKLKHDLLFNKLKEGWMCLNGGLLQDSQKILGILIQRYKQFMPPDILIQTYIYAFRIYFILEQWNESKKYLMLARQEDLKYAATYKLLGMVEFEIGNYSASKTMFQKALRLSRSNGDKIEQSEIYSEMAVCLQKHITNKGPMFFKNIQQKLSYLIDKSISFNPDNKSAFKLRQNLPFFMIQIGYQYIDANIYEKASEIYENIFKKYGNDIEPEILTHVHIFIARICFALQKWDETKKHLIDAKQNSPSNAAVYKLLGMVEFEFKNYQSAIKMFQTALRLSRNPDDKIQRSEIYYEAAVCLKRYSAEKDISNAEFRFLTLIKKSVSLNPNNRLAVKFLEDFFDGKLQTGWEYLSKELYDKSKEFSQELIKKYERFMTPNVFMKIYVYISRIYHALKQWGQSKKYLIMAKERNLSYAPVYKLLGMVEFELGNYLESKKMFQTALRFSRLSGDKIEQSEIYSEMAVCLQKYINNTGPMFFKNIQQKLSYLTDKSISLNPDNKSAFKLRQNLPLFMIQIGYQYIDANMYEKASEIYKDIFKQYGNDIEPEILTQVHVFIGRVCFSLKKWDESKTYLMTAKQENFKNAAVYKLLGMVEFEFKNYQSAIKMFQTALRLSRNPDDKIQRSEIYFEAALCIKRYYESKNVENAEFKFLTLVKKSVSLNLNKRLAVKFLEDFFDGKLQTGWEYLSKELYDKSKEFSQELIKKYERFMTPNVFMKIYVYISRIYHGLKQWDQSKKYLIMAKERNLSYAPVYKLLGMVEFELGNYLESKKMFQTALRLSRLSGDKIEQSEIYYEFAVCIEKYVIKTKKQKIKNIKNRILRLIEKAVMLNHGNNEAVKKMELIINSDYENLLKESVVYNN